MYLILFGKRCTVGSLLRVSLYDQSQINKRKSYLDKAFGRIDEKALLVKKSDDILADGRMDLAAHCLKDLPTALPSTTQLVTIVEGKCPGDAFVLNGNNENIRL
jgi:porphobilinogen deaminase